MRAKVQRSVNLLMLLTLAHIGFFIYTLYLNDWQVWCSPRKLSHDMATACQGLDLS